MGGFVYNLILLPAMTSRFTRLLEILCPGTISMNMFQKKLITLFYITQASYVHS